MKGTKEILHDFKQRLEMIFGRQVNRVNILDFEELTSEMRQDLAVRLRMVYTRGKGQLVFASHARMRLFWIQAPLIREFILEFLSTCRMSDIKMELDAPEKVIEVDLFDLRSTDRGTANIPHLLGLRGLQVVTHELLLIDLHELGRLNICSRFGDTWAWVALGPERHNYRRTSQFGSTNEFPTPMTPSAAAMAAAYAMLAALFNMYYFCCCLGNLTEYPTAKMLWDALVVTYSSGRDKLQTLNLHVKANDIKQNDSPLEELWITLQGVWGEIDRIDPNPMKYPDDIKAYAKIREILRSESLPFAEAAYATVPGLAATEAKGVGLATKGYLHSGERKNRPTIKEDKTHQKCGNCGKTRHTEDQCFELVSYPDWWNDGHKKGNKGLRSERGKARIVNNESNRKNATSFGDVVAATPDEGDEAFMVETGSRVILSAAEDPKIAAMRTI
uniref:Uncharacterized protein n=1 Tax=Tanacetum cinerariifolium TaxID=118510 RepID=A0A6L2MBX7_TANCI|nr:hypothetical protein [Tanacetum cinerariifolium]